MDTNYDFIFKPYLNLTDKTVLIRRAKKIGKEDDCRSEFEGRQVYLDLKKSDILGQVFNPKCTGTCYIPTMIKSNEGSGQSAYTDNLYEELVTGDLGNFEVV